MLKRPSVRRLVLVAALGLAVGGALLGLRALGPEPEPQVSAPATEADAEPDGTSSVVLRIERGEPEDAPAIPRPTGLLTATAQDYRERARYPRWSHPIRDGVDPILRDREVTPGRSRGPDGEDPTLVITSKKVSFEAPEPAVIFAKLVQDGGTVPAQSLRGEVRTEDGTVVAELRFEDDGDGPDERAGDDVYTAVVAPGESGLPEMKGAYLVDVTATTREGEARNATSGFLYSVPKAHLTGRFREARVDGSLLIEAEVRVEERSRFHLEATLGAPDGEPVAWAQNAAELAPGSAWIPLTFYGLALRESGRDGPYVLRSVALSTAGEMPNQKNEVSRDAYRTRPYRAGEFTDRAFNDPDLLGAADRLERSGGLDPSQLEVGAP